jgi:hypothetical protein
MFFVFFGYFSPPLAPVGQKGQRKNKEHNRSEDATTFTNTSPYFGKIIPLLCQLRQC